MKPDSMLDQNYDVIVVGGGPAGLAAALAAWESGVKKVLLLERNENLGGILNQCIHNGFGLHYFKEELTGPEYAEKFIDKITATGIQVVTGAMVLQLSHNKTLEVMHSQLGYLVLHAKAVVLTMGCRERTRGGIGIAGSRPAGVFTAGAAQLYMNIEGYQIGRRAVILGSGDIGLIMARRLTLEGAKVLGVFEVMPYSGGLTRNKVQCLDDYGIPLSLSHTITKIQGDKRVESVIVQKVDENRVPISGTEQLIECDTVLLSVGLIPENELSSQAGIKIDPRTKGPEVFDNMETNIPGIFACGNVAHVHDLVDFVTGESLRAGKSAAEYCLLKQNEKQPFVGVEPGSGINYVVPQKIRASLVETKVELFFRVSKTYKNCKILIADVGNTIAEFKREHMAPGEMEKVILPKKLLDTIHSQSITISIVAEDKL